VERRQFDLAKAHYMQANKCFAGHADSYRNRGILYALYIGDKGCKQLADYKIIQALLDFFQKIQV